jgi:hypothetical protein
MAHVSNPKAVGRLAGLAYLVIILFSIAGYATLSWLLAGYPQIVLGRLAANQTVFTLAVVASAIGFAAWVVLVLLLYRLMSSAGRIAGFLMVIFGVAGTVTNLIALWRLFPLVGSASSGMDAATLWPMMWSYRHLLLLSQIFSGLWLFPFGWLVLRSRIAPRLLGLCLIVGGFAYLLQFATAFEPGLGQMMAFRIIGTAAFIPAMIGEFGMCLWLLIKGASEPDLARAA